jgi:Mg-chelatase subunit ChlD
MDKNLIKIFIFLFIVTLMGCGENNSNKLKNAWQRNTLRQTYLNFNNKDGKSNWPELNSQDKQINLAPNLLAKNYYIVFDASGSMNESQCAEGTTKIAVAKKALSEFVRSIPGDANIGLLVFDSARIHEIWPFSVNSVVNQESLIQKINAVSAGNGTPLHESIFQAYRRLEEQGRKQLGYGEYHLVTITDGAATLGPDPADLVNEIVDKTPVNIHTIGFCISEQHSLNQPGRTIYRSADNQAELTRGLKEILAESETFDVKDFKY